MSNFNLLPNDIKLLIYQMNKDREKHNYLLRKCFSELKQINDISHQYLLFIKKCIGFSVWKHFDDYRYWIQLEKIENPLIIKGYEDKGYLIKLIIIYNI